jgi:vacuolar protein sorting-associated protein 13A/C
MNHKIDKDTPQVDAQVLFDEFGFLIDDDQYRDTLSMVDLFHFYTRTQQYTRFRPPETEFRHNPARARLKFAANAIRSEIHEKDRKWSWAYFAERRDDRRAYVDLYTKMKLAAPGTFVGLDATALGALEAKLPYEDIRFYRSIAKAELRKNAASRRKLEEEKAAAAAAAQPQGWIGWAFGAATAKKADVPHEAEGEAMTESDRRGLLSLVGYNPDVEHAPTPDVPRDALKLRLSAKLKTGSLALRRDPHGAKTDVLAIVWDALQADAVKYTDSMDATVTLGGFRVYDGTTPNSVYPQIVRVKDDVASVDRRRALQARDQPAEQQQLELSQSSSNKNPFFSLRFENNPLDQRADNAVTVKMRHLEIIYHKAYVENVFRFFKPPESQLESINALIDVASETLDGIRKETRAGLEFALQQHKTVDIKLDMNAPIIIIPEDVVDPNCQHVVLDAGHIAVESNLVAKEALAKIRAKEAQQYTDDDFKNLENLMYDRFTIRLEAAQVRLSLVLRFRAYFPID